MTFELTEIYQIKFWAISIKWIALSAESWEPESFRTVAVLRQAVEIWAEDSSHLWWWSDHGYGETQLFMMDVAVKYFNTGKDLKTV